LSPAFALAGAIRKPSRGAARADRLIREATERGARMGSSAAAIGVMQADIHGLCDELAALKSPDDGTQETVYHGGVMWIVDLDRDGSVWALWINGGWVEAHTFGESFKDTISDAYREQHPAEDCRADDPEYNSAAVAERYAGVAA
jgi:hypothetical protein